MVEYRYLVWYKVGKNAKGKTMVNSKSVVASSAKEAMAKVKGSTKANRMARIR
jgi:hypothetical protein